MGFFDGFPFTNTHQLNLDWILAKLKSVESISEDAKAAIERANSAVERAENAASNSQHYSEQAAGVVQTLYGVGSIYISTNHISPAIFFGGTWERIEGRFLVGASAAYSNGSTGGEANVTLSEATIPSHRHIETIGIVGLGTCVFDGGQDSTGWNAEYYYGDNLKIKALQNSVSGTTSTTALTTVGAGGGQAHNNMPPYLAVYMWKRVA